ncbi:alpha/beta hydrolase [Haloplanus ruber]|uniref:Alpha/beta hydrolase n=1 Tax=Haloplanus ruber TaxID=869892 RepID=A0ABD6CZ55_9EURY|nr:alpha/beta hydrolase [Haloplanus ruber]
MPAATDTRSAADRFEFATTTLTFESEAGARRGRLYRPDRPSSSPVVVLGPTVAAESTFGYPRYAERFARAGYAAFVFDHRPVGDDGPRTFVDPAAQVADWRAAVDRVRRLDGERRRVVLWGFGLGGGHVIRVAAERRRVAATVAVSPLDGRAFARGRSPGYLARAVTAGVRDRLGAPLGRSQSVPVVGGPGEFGLLPRTPAGEAYLDCIPPASDWHNETPARGLLSLFRYRPLADAADVDCPTLVIAAGRDDLVSPETAAAAADCIDDATFLRLPVGHVDPLGDAFETAVAHQLAFLESVVDAR